MFEKKRLHPVAMLLSVVKAAREAALPLIFFVFVGGGEGYSWWHFLIIGSLLLFTLGNGVLGWFFYTYHIENNELRIHQGFVFRKKRFIPRERIQSIDFSQGLIQRAFGLVKVQIETAGGGGEPEVVMSALRRTDAELLRSELYQKRKAVKEEAMEEAEKQQPVLYQLSWRELLITASTSGGIGVVLSFVAAIASQVDDFIPNRFYESVTERVLDATVPLLLLAVAFLLLISWFFSVIGTVLKYGGFVLTRHENDLIINRGILEKRQLTIPVHRIQAIRVVEGILRQPFGYSALYVESGGGGGKEEQFSTILFPLVKRKRVKTLLREILPEMAIHEERSSLPLRAKKRYLIRFLLPVIIPVGVLTYLVPYGAYSLLLLPICCVIGYFHYHDAGFGIKKDVALLQFRQISKTTVYVARKNIQSMEMETTILQNPKQLTTFKVSILSSLAGKQFKVKDIESSSGEQLLNWYSFRSKKIEK
ncbi:PH domain-containing protein [Guptibacillus spartinae]|uniref:PH domain-containing protein n=1 Tax=Guptibacillus spartinae TaxID=3025679 RepID=UPI00235E7676|nr:PH domain-containing protein [Pseudalkalibacillus spartinae]